jgi:hypothetical protein
MSLSSTAYLEKKIAEITQAIETQDVFTILYQVDELGLILSRAFPQFSTAQLKIKFSTNEVENLRIKLQPYLPILAKLSTLKLPNTRNNKDTYAHLRLALQFLFDEEALISAPQLTEKEIEEVKKIVLTSMPVAMLQDKLFSSTEKCQTFFMQRIAVHPNLVVVDEHCDIHSYAATFYNDSKTLDAALTDYNSLQGQYNQTKQEIKVINKQILDDQYSQLSTQYVMQDNTNKNLLKKIDEINVAHEKNTAKIIVRDVRVKVSKAFMAQAFGEVDESWKDKLRDLSTRIDECEREDRDLNAKLNKFNNEQVLSLEEIQSLRIDLQKSNNQQILITSQLPIEISIYEDICKKIDLLENDRLELLEQYNNIRLQCDMPDISRSGALEDRREASGSLVANNQQDLESLRNQKKQQLLQKTSCYKQTEDIKKHILFTEQLLSDLEDSHPDVQKNIRNIQNLIYANNALKEKHKQQHQNIEKKFSKGMANIAGKRIELEKAEADLEIYTVQNNNLFLYMRYARRSLQENVCLLNKINDKLMVVKNMPNNARVIDYPDILDNSSDLHYHYVKKTVELQELEKKLYEAKIAVDQAKKTLEEPLSSEEKLLMEGYNALNYFKKIINKDAQNNSVNIDQLQKNLANLTTILEKDTAPKTHSFLRTTALIVGCFILVTPIACVYHKITHKTWKFWENPQLTAERKLLHQLRGMAEEVAEIKPTLLSVEQENLAPPANAQCYSPITRPGSILAK